MHELDRLFDRHDVAREICVDVIDQRRQRRRFARTGRAGHEHESAAELAELFHHRRNPEFLERGDLRRDQAEDRAVAVRLLEKIAAEARFLIHLVGEIEIAAFVRKVPNSSVPQISLNIETASSCVTGSVADRHDVAVPADLRRLSFADVQDRMRLRSTRTSKNWSM